ncbi:pyridoxal phosphate-dependent aminotransferase [Pseudoteredinibacter isoporae]|uniref:histidinol-phosphate transaminase n=1 Tax=Pseudoteredinibacter isoporae TaxID=570281 RepID=A0A7X0JRB6_9GAMM|nr:histidinol-phosphate transaminase [Pseudoteredinibacter isoporae]MBB6520858.1 histidinol-phosphate aminotransferase [Pseudoteredinibacter isoporae]NHO86423.1 histidinol-phosphate aminotransferase family protein [Pseudoteredinibacter isoporae]NIB25125.1 histidinol-phosphate aminotransferase family protein [Pseudoteredinibacter isoporae]
MGIFKDHIEAMAAYTPPLEGRNPDDFTLLDFNERTIPVSQAIKQALVDYVQGNRLQQYPHYGDICDRLAQYCGVQADQVMVTNGSDQGIDLIIRACCREGDEIIIPAPSFAMYEQVAKVENLKIIKPIYERESGYPLAEVKAAITARTKMIVVSNPNNPCGTLLNPDGIVNLASSAPDVAILVDECYYEYSQCTVAHALDRCPNIVITRTFSKTWGIPSLRFGYVLAAKENIQALLNVRGPYDINQLAVVAAVAALDNPEYTEQYVAEVMGQAKPKLEGFLTERGIEFWPSAANYLWVFPDRPEAVNKCLQQATILVRPKADADGRVGLRMTVGTCEQTEQLISILEQCL